MEPWTLQNGLIRLISGSFALISAAALFICLIVTIMHIAGIVAFFSNPYSLSWRDLLIFTWSGFWCAIAVAAGGYNFSWSIGNMDRPKWRPVLQVAALSLLISVVSPFVWAFLL